MFFREVFFSRLAGRKVNDASGKRLGLVRDIVVSFAETSAYVVGICVGQEGYFPVWSLIGGLAAEKLVIAEKTPKQDLLTEKWRIAKLLLDRQVIDRSGKRVRRINDLVFASCGANDTEERAFFVGADIGSRGLVRRLGAEWLLDWKKNRFLPWRSIAMVGETMLPGCLRFVWSESMTSNDVTEICRKLGRDHTVQFLRQLARSSVRRSQTTEGDMDGVGRLEALVEELPIELQRIVWSDTVCTKILPKEATHD